ncbi:O-methyltransferase [Lentzea albidocapillata subsp. violacea]|uniref:O-methyltransferase n=1 Tax=Lentzea albidocapillata subsp. violacea TaxID=128104 RepID=A0A1G9XUL5_9PSEU|nr:TylF/MycF/NovP-related O-methyltransferase [Lentzea albidocapillata]SDN00430.1 O-methyltransferase [Lentzea albidocapillata subsp. violacea]
MRVRMAIRLATQNAAMTDFERLNAIYWALSTNLIHKVPGAIVELGCNAGLTSVWLARIIQDLAPERELHLFDSFEGLPQPGVLDSYLKEGDCLASIDQLKMNFDAWELPQPEVHQGWFEQTLPDGCPPEICFAYLDGDFYDSITTSLTHVYPKLAPGGVILVDDYCDLDANPRAWDGLPGVKKACDDYFGENAPQLEVLGGVGDLSLALIRKPLADG